MTPARRVRAEVTDDVDAGRGPHCATLARRRGDPMLGTAAPGRRWLLIEHPAGWARAALDSSGFTPALADLLQRTALEIGGRVLLVRRPGRRAHRDVTVDPLRWAVVDVDGSQRWGTWRTEADLEEAAWVLRVDGRPAAAETHPPLLLVCTHGTHDVCCAMRGRPVAAALAAVWPEQTWECSHVGGDRFAANLLMLPDGTVYGGLDATDAVQTVRQHLAGAVSPEHLRGFSPYPPVVQAALAAVLRERGPAAATDVRPRSVHEAGAGEWVVGVAGQAPLPATSTVRVRRSVQPPARLTCAAQRDEPAYVYTAEIIE